MLREGGPRMTAGTVAGRLTDSAGVRSIIRDGCRTVGVATAATHVVRRGSNRFWLRQEAI